MLITFNPLSFSDSLGPPPISLPISCLVYFYNLWSQLILSISQCVGDHSVRHGQPTNGHIPKKSDSLFP